MLKGNTFSNSGKAEKDHILIKNRGIVNVEFSNNTFQNNPVKRIAILWGEKGQVPGENTIINSGKIEVVQNLKLKLMY
jgi:poly(beta-D-mannuronate) lyase